MKLNNKILLNGTLYMPLLPYPKTIKKRKIKKNVIITSFFQTDLMFSSFSLHFICFPLNVPYYLALSKIIKKVRSDRSERIFYLSKFCLTLANIIIIKGKSVSSCLLSLL